MSEYYLNIPTAPYNSAPYVELPVYLGVNWGLSVYAIEFSIRCDLTDAGATVTIGSGDNQFGNNTLISCLVGAGNGSTGYIQVRGASPSTGQIVVASSSTGIPIKDGQFHTYRFEHDINGTCRFIVDGTVYGATSSFTTDVNGTVAAYGVKRIFRTLNGVIQGNIRCRYIKYEGFTNSDTWDANLSNGTATVFPSLSGTRDGVQAGSSWPTDNSEWISLVTAVPVLVSINKTTYTPIAKSIAVSLGAQASVAKSPSNVLNKILSASCGVSTSTLKRDYVPTSKQLSVGLSFIAAIQRSISTVVQKPLYNVVGSNLNVDREVGSINLLPLTMAQSTPLLNVLKSTITVQHKSLGITVDVKLPADVDVSATDLDIIRSHIAANIGLVGNVGRTSLNMTGKVLSVTLAYPLIPVEQIYKLTNRHNFIKFTNKRRFFNLSDK